VRESLTVVCTYNKTIKLKTGKTCMSIPLKLLNDRLWTREFALVKLFIKNVNISGRIGLTFMEIIPEFVPRNIGKNFIYIVQP